MLDLLVIGAGLSGLTAAARAAQAGLAVRVIAKGLGAQHWGAGTLDLLGYLPDHTPVAAPLAALNSLPADHPLRQVGAAQAQRSLATIADWLAAAGLPYQGGADGRNLALPSAIGAARPVYLAPAAQAAARLDDPTPLLIVGFDHLRDFYPNLLADNLARQGHAARSHTLPSALLTTRGDANTVHLAHALDDPATATRLGEALAAVVRPGERLALPAILGLDQHPAVVARVQAITGATVAEIPTLPPSVPGIRLHRALVQQLSRPHPRHAGGRVEANMTAVEFHAQDGAIQWVATATSARPLRHTARAYLLATGGILGGGINTDAQGRAWEVIFDLPLALPLTLPTARAQWFRPGFLDPAGHPIFQSGVAVNADWQPVDAAGQPIYANLWAAGNLLAHADSLRTRSHEGLAVVTAAAAVAAILVRHRHAPASAGPVPA